MSADTRSRHRGFTLVELLVVIAIIALLVAILLPALKKVKQGANRTVCASNMRQIAMALLMYAHDSRDFFPAPSYNSYPQPEDWIHFQSSRKLEESRIWKYIGRSDRALQCPSGVFSVQNPALNFPGTGYPYSYAVNQRITGYWVRGFNGLEFPTAALPHKLNKIRNPSIKILLAEMPAEQRAGSDGAWRPDELEFPTIRHDTQNDRDFARGWELGDGRRRANVACVDGHCTFITIAEASHPYRADPGYTGGPPAEGAPWPYYWK